MSGRGRARDDARSWLIDCTNMTVTAKYLCLHLPPATIPQPWTVSMEM